MRNTDLPDPIWQRSMADRARRGIRGPWPGGWPRIFGCYTPDDFALSWDGRLLAVRPAPVTPIVQIWDVAKRQRVMRIDKESGTGSLAFFTGTDVLAEEYPTVGLSLRNAPSGSEVGTIRSGRAMEYSFSPVDQIVAVLRFDPVAQDGQVLMWDAAGEPVCGLDGPFRAVWRSQGQFSGDGRRFVAELEPKPGESSTTRVGIFALTPEERQDGEAREVAVRLPPPAPAAEKTPPPDAGVWAPEGVAALPLRRDEGDHCHLYKVPLDLDEEALTRLQLALGEAEIEEESLRLGFSEFGEFETSIGEERLTKRVFPIPGSTLRATVAVYYTDEALFSAEGWESVRMALAVSPEEVDAPFLADGAALFEGTYSDHSGVLRLKTVVARGDDRFLLGLECDTTRKWF